jgi:hypothetical protein
MILYEVPDEEAQNYLAGYVDGLVDHEMDMPIIGQTPHAQQRYLDKNQLVKVLPEDDYYWRGFQMGVHGVRPMEVYEKTKFLPILEADVNGE